MTLATQRIETVFESSEHVEGLSRHVYTVLESLRITFDGAGVRCAHRIINGIQAPPMDTASYDLFQGSRMIGKYEFRLQNDQYNVILDLSGLEKKMYDAVIKKVGEQYPQFTPAPVI